MSVICMRDFNSLRCACTAKMLTWLVSMSSAISCGRSVSGRGARSSSTNALNGEPTLHQFVRDAGCDLAAVVVGDDRDFFRRLNPQAGIHRVVGAGRKFGVECGFGEIGENGLGQKNGPFQIF